jgi:MFS family permease
MFQSLNRHYLAPIRSFNRAARLFLLMTIIDGVILSGWQLFFNFYMLQSGFSREFLGLANSLPSAGGLIFGLLVGRFSDRIGRKPSLIIGIGFASLFMLAQVTFRQPQIIAASAFLTGVFNMLFLVSQAPLMVKLSGTENRTMLFSLNYGLQTISGAIGSLFAGQLPTFFGVLLNVQAQSAAAYQAVLIVSILLGMTSLIPIWLMKEPSAPAATDALHPSIVPPAPQTEAVASISSRKNLSPALISLTAKMTGPQVLIGFGAAILIPYMNVFFKVRFDISDPDLGILFSVSSLLIGIGSIMAPWLSTRLGGKVRAVVVTQFGSLVFLLLTGFAPFLWLSSIGYLLRTALMNMSAPLYSAFCMESTPEHHQGFVNSILNIAWNIGWAVGPFISGIVQERYGFTPLFIATSVLYFLAISLAWAFFKNTEKNKVAPRTVLLGPEYMKE